MIAIIGHIIFTASRKKIIVNNRACMWALGIFNLGMVKDYFFFKLGMKPYTMHLIEKNHFFNIRDKVKRSSSELPKL